MSTRTYKIIDGPDKDTIFESIKSSYNSENRKPVFFKTDCFDAYFSVLITSLEHDNETGLSFAIKGSVGLEIFQGYYNSETHKGYLKITN